MYIELVYRFYIDNTTRSRTMSKTPLEEVKQTKKVKPVVEAVTAVVEEVKKVKEVSPKPVTTPIVRMLQEKKELDAKVKRLFTFTRGEMNGVSKASCTLLCEQLTVMEVYSDILGKRIKLMGG